MIVSFGSNINDSNLLYSTGNKYHQKKVFSIIKKHC